MNKREFLEILRQALSGEVSNDVIEQNIKYYENYISSQSSGNEEAVIDMLGDPRLIAKTIIEAERAAKSKTRGGGGYRDNEWERTYSKQDEYSDQNNERQRHTSLYTSLNWVQKITLVFIILILIVILLFIGRIIVGFLFVFGVPILLLVLLYVLFKRRN